LYHVAPLGNRQNLAGFQHQQVDRCETLRLGAAGCRIGFRIGGGGRRRRWQFRASGGGGGRGRAAGLGEVDVGRLEVVVAGDRLAVADPAADDV
jgi:hypothetical protein